MSYSPFTYPGAVTSPTPQTPGGSSSDSDDSLPDFALGSAPKRAEGALGQAELLLEGLAEDLNTLQTRAQAVYLPRREEDGPLIHATVREVVEKLSQLDALAPSLNFLVPTEILNYLDEGSNPDDFTRRTLENTAAENQFTNGKVHAIHSYLGLLSAGLATAFPELAPHVQPPPLPGVDPQTTQPSPPVEVVEVVPETTKEEEQEP